MSHIVTIQVEVKDFDAIKSTARRLNLKEPIHGKAMIFNTKIEGVIVELGHDWIYPVVCVLETGEVKFDTFNGNWGDEKHLHRFVQQYAVEKVAIESRRHGHSVVEQPLVDGSIKLTVNMGGAA